MNIEEQLAKAECERDEALAKYQWMVDRACDEKLDGYRELGAKCAQLEEERDEAQEAYREARASRWHVSKKWDEALNEIERLRTENRDMSRAITDAIEIQRNACTDAYHRGAEAMREAAAKRAWAKICENGRTAILRSDPLSQSVRDAIRALPIPEEP